MQGPANRREFLKSSALGIAALSSTAAWGEPGNAVPPNPASSLSVWITEGNRRLEKQSASKWENSHGAPGAASIVVDPAKSYQQILGFGAALTDAACYTLTRLDASARENLFHELFHSSKMGLSVCRTCVGSSDYSTEAFTYNEGDADPDLKRFSIEHDRPYVLPVLRQARKVNPDLFLFSSPWTPPGWMKSNKSMLGGNMQRHYMASYAKYFVKFLQAYESEGVFVNAITVQNEVDTDQDGRMPQCAWPMEYEADFVRQHLGPTFETSGVKTKIWIVDHNYNLWGRAMAELETPGVRKYTNAIAWHGYVGKPEWMMRVLEAYPDVEMYWTEGGPDYTESDYLTNWAKWSSTFAGILRNGCRAITGWNIALDERGKPNIGPFNCGGMVTIHSQTKEITRSGQHWAFAHFSQFVRRGAHRIESSGGGDLAHAAFVNPDGSRVLVVANTGADRAVEARVGQQSTPLNLGANSVATLVWQ